MKSLPAFVVVSLLVYNSYICDSIEPSQEDQGRYTNLVRQLITRYKEQSEPFIPPYRREHHSYMEVNFSWYLEKILQFNEHDQYVEFDGLIRMEWFDGLLQWNYSETKIEHVELPTEIIYTPKLELDESRSHDFASIFFENHLVSAHHNGSVSWTSPVKTSSSCQVVQKRFPFNQQACTFTFAPVDKQQTEIHFRYISKPIHSVSNGVWEMKNVTVPECQEKMKFKNRMTIRFVVHLQRHRPSLYVLVLAVPPLVVSVLMFMAFLLPARSDQKIPLLVATILVLFVYQGYVDNYGPPTGVPLLGWFVIAEVAEGTLLVFFSIISIRIQHDYPCFPCFNYQRCRRSGPHNCCCTNDELENQSISSQSTPLVQDDSIARYQAVDRETDQREPSAPQTNGTESLRMEDQNRSGINTLNVQTETFSNTSTNNSDVQRRPPETTESFTDVEAQNVKMSKKCDNITGILFLIVKGVVIFWIVILLCTAENDPVPHV